MQSILNRFRAILKYLQSVSKAPSDTEAVSACNLISENMAEHFTLVENLYENNTQYIDWLADGEVKSLRLLPTIAREIARTVCSEAEITVDGTSERAKYLNKQLSIFFERLPVYVEQGVALGNLAFKPYLSDNDIYVDVSRIGGFIPVRADSSGSIVSCVFVENLIHNNSTYTKLEYHHIDNGIYTIENTAYCSSSVFRSNQTGYPGRQVPLTEVPEWAKIEPIVLFETTDGTMPMPLYSIYRNPFANSIDINSILGVSIAADCIDLIREADEAWSGQAYEMKSGERRLFIPRSAIPKGDKKLSRTYEEVNFDDDDKFYEFSPAFRNEAINKYIQSIFKRIEQNAGLSFGILSDPQSVAKTATEIKSSKDVLQFTVTSVQKAFKKAVEQLVDAMSRCCNIYGITPDGPYQLICTWGDNVVESSEEKQAQAMLLYQTGAIDEVELFRTIKGMTVKEAEAYVSEMQQRKARAQNAQQGTDWFKNESEGA